jgi:hypothetical protein
MILERAVQKIASGKFDAYKAGEQKWSDLEKRLGGFPPKCHYSSYSGPLAMGTIVWQREWPDFASMEVAYSRMFGEPEAQELSGNGVIAEEIREYYFVEEY